MYHYHELEFDYNPLDLMLILTKGWRVIQQQCRICKKLVHVLAIIASVDVKKEIAILFACQWCYL